MKGCAQSALISFLGLVAAIVAISVGLQQWRGFGRAETIGVSLFGGFCLWIAGNLVLSAATARRERATLAGGLAGGLPAEDGATIVTGYIEPLGGTLVAPLSGRECVAYTFEIYDFIGSGKRRTRVTYCDGLALVPSTIVTRAGSVRLLAVPELDCDESPLDSAARSRAAEVMRTAPYDPPAPSAKPEVEAQWSDVDGDYQRLRLQADGADLEKCRLSERAIERGAPVCVFGQYSTAKRAIVADPEDWSKITRVMKGDAASIVKQLGSSMRWRALFACVSAALGLGAVVAFAS